MFDRVLQFLCVFELELKSLFYIRGGSSMKCRSFLKKVVVGLVVGSVVVLVIV